jgi:cell division protein FtsI/penicillin-binding protein 2
MKARLLLAAIFSGMLFAAITARLVFLQVVEHDLWLEYARAYERKIIKLSRRGTIFDRGGIPLAFDIKTISIALDNYHMTKPEVLSSILKEKLGISNPDELIYRESYFTWIKRKVSPKLADEIKKATEKEEVNGLIFIEEWKRVYPYGDLASNLIGFAGLDNQGLEGVEFYFDDTLRGEDEVSLVTFADGKLVRRRVLQKGEPGKDIFLTIDVKIQYIAEKAIDEGVRRFKAKDGFVIVMDPQTGEVLAMAQSKRYDLNQDLKPQLNLAVTYPFEPGSAFKIFAGLAALEYGAVTPNTWVSGNQPVTVGGHRFHNAMNKNWGSVNLAEIIKHSINTGMIRVAQRLGEGRLYEFLTYLGFGEETGIELPGEVRGTLRHPRQWSKLEIGAIPIGQSVSVTGIQLIQATAAIANGGKLLAPTIIKGKAPQVTGEIASPKNIYIIKEMMRGVITEGTGRPAEIKGFGVAGKTGTAQKALPGKGYVEGKYYSLFVGFFPYKEPEYIILVVLDEVGTEPFWGGQTAGVVFKEIAEAIISLRKLEPVGDSSP